MNYTPLYVFSEYSMLHSTCHIDKLIEKCKEYGLNSLAVTDDNTTHAYLKLYKACKKENIKFIFGLKLDYQFNNTIFTLLVYAKNKIGYQNLLRLSTLLKTKNSPLTLADLQNNSDGVLAVSYGVERTINNYLPNRNQLIIDHLNKINNIYQDFYIGLNAHFSLNATYDFYKKLGKKMVAVTPIYYLEETDLEGYRVLRSLANSATEVKLNDEEKEAYFKSNQEMEFLYRSCPELINNTKEISDKCQVDIVFEGYLVPQYQEGLDARRYLYELAHFGLKKRLSTMERVNPNIYLKRLDYELNTINEMGFNDYFLIVYDYVKYAKKNQIMVGPGRGSAGASLVAFSLGITDIDPIKYNLLFERFLNKERITMPDIDIDFQNDKRGQVIDYISQKYGINRVAHICTFQTFQVRSAIGNTARVYKINDSHLKEVLKYVDYELGLNSEISLLEIIEKNEKIKQLIESYDDIANLLKAACLIYNLPSNKSTHTAGILITKNDLTNYTALDLSVDNILQTQLEAPDLEELGLLKMDLLALKNLTNIAATINLIHHDNPLFKLPKDENDPRVYKMLANGNVLGVFQLESEGMISVLKRMNISYFSDLVSAIALYRPGPMDEINHFIDRKFGKEQVEYPHPILKEILKDTYGTIVYQEQIMLIATTFAGYSLGKADVLRRAVAKKKKEVLEEERTKFVSSSVRNGYLESDAQKIYDYIVKFADYGFNKAHSVAYAKLAYQTAYLKYYYPNYYLGVLYSSVLGSDKDVNEYYKECLKCNITVFPPDINYSLDRFLPVQGGIVYPLNGIKGLGNVKIKEIIKEREKGRFKSYKDFIERTKNFLSLSVITSIIYSGALDIFGLTKKALIETAKTHIDMADYSDLPGLRKVEYPQDEYSFTTLSEREKEAIGLNIKYNFFVQYAGLYEEKGLVRLKDIKLNMQIHTMGKVEKLKNMKTKKSENMARFILTDNTSQVECVIFPIAYQKVQNIEENTMVELFGSVRLNEKNSQNQIVVEDLKTL